MYRHVLPGAWWCAARLLIVASARVEHFLAGCATMLQGGELRSPECGLLERSMYTCMSMWLRHCGARLPHKWCRQQKVLDTVSAAAIRQLPQWVGGLSPVCCVLCIPGRSFCMLCCLPRAGVFASTADRVLRLCRAPAMRATSCAGSSATVGLFVASNTFGSSSFGCCVRLRSGHY